MLWWRFCRWISSPFWQSRERLKYDAEGWHFARGAKIAIDRIREKKQEVRSGWIVTERRDSKDPEVEKLKAVEDTLNWVLEEMNAESSQRRD